MLDHLTDAVVRHTPHGWSVTDVPRLRLIAADGPGVPVDLVYEPMICFVTSGSKRVDFGARHVLAGSGQMMFNALAVPVLASFRETPYRAAILHLDPEPLAALLLELDSAESRSPATIAPADGQMTCAMPPQVVDAVTRWVQLLDTPEDIPILAHRAETEILYRLLRGPLGPSLRGFVASNSAQTRIRTAADWICTHYDQPLRVDAIAAVAHMSVPTLHRQFRAATGMSPIAFQKQLRLQHARRLLLNDGANAAQVARAVGYSTPNQFNREYRRSYGSPPLQDALRLRRQWNTAEPSTNA
ncbi:AraC family transcriptional regulator [Rhodococcus sp. IEGM 1379]|uniref:AraC family transcriptional regulator n=1 Tax=Rhodococcus sp. IEGM 1379 TaxID=3047086 RepID=UPI0024B7A23B|nr:AraC family transcriptional regulator [Rhodococcus sp. IEGM 1379]MDI9918881.1 AraC family transcriptional regulator [Rhodococcus sp. IEGM 1379]